MKKLKFLVAGLAALALLVISGVGQAHATTTVSGSLLQFNEGTSRTLYFGRNNSMMYENGTQIALKSDLNIIALSANTTSGEIRFWSHALPGTAGAVNIGSATKEWGNVYMADSKNLYLGSDQDVYFGFDGTDVDVLSLADDAVWKWGQSGTAFDMWWYGNAVTNTIKVDASANTMTYDDIDLYMGDNDLLVFGDGSDLQMRWDGTNFDVTDGTNAFLTITDDGSVGSATVSGNITASGDLTVSGGDISITPKSAAGTASEGNIYYDSDDDNLYVYADGSWVDLTQGAGAGISLDDGYNNDAGERTIVVDGGNVSWDLADGATDYDFVVDLQGTGNTFEIQDAGTAVFTVADAGATTLLGTFTVGVDDTGHDVKFFGATASSYLLWDESDDRLELDGADINLQDADILQFGDAQDVYMRWDAVDLDILAAADDSIIRVGQDGTAFDLWWYGDASTNNVVFDAGASKVTFDDVDLYAGDNDLMVFGDGSDVTMRWDATDFDVLPVANNAVWKWGQNATAFDMWWYGATTAANVVFDASANTWTYDDVDVMLGDNDILYFGDGSDMYARWDGTNLDVLGTANSQIYFGVDDDGFDVRLYGDTSGVFVEWDQSADQLEFQDNAMLAFGAADDVVMRWDATDFDVLPVANNAVWKWGQNATAFDMWWYGAATTNNVVFDASANMWTYDDVDVTLGDNDILKFGDATGSDVYMRWDNTDFNVLAIANDTVWKWGDNATAFDMWWYGAATTNNVVFDASANMWTYDDVDVTLGDNDSVILGDSTDVTIRWDATDLDILPAAHHADFKIGQNATAFDLYWYGNTTAQVILADSTNNKLALDDVDLYIGDNDLLVIGDGSDVTIRWDETDLDVLPVANDAVWKWGQNATAFDMWWYGATTAANVVFDASGKTWTYDDVDLYMGDNDVVALGDAQDVTMDWDGTNLDILGAADDEIIRFGNGTNSFDVIWYGNAATNLVTLDAGANTLTLDDVDFYLGDNDIAAFGDSQDVTAYWDASNFYLDAAANNTMFYIGDDTNDFDITWYSAGGTIVADASGNLVTVDGIDMLFNDDDKIGFGDTGLFYIEYDEDGDDNLVITDGTNEMLALSDGGTVGNLTVTGWVRPYVGTTAPGSLVEGAIAVDSSEQDCFNAGDGTDGGSLCVYTGAAWAIAHTW